MTVGRFLTDEHVPGPCITVLRSIGHDVLRAKDEFQEGTKDGVLLEFASETDRIVLTSDKRFTIVEGDRVTRTRFARRGLVCPTRIRPAAWRRRPSTSD